MDKRLLFPATERNKDFIGAVLSGLMPQNGSVLEIGSGSGEHGVYFQKRFPEVTWQTSDPNPIYRESIKDWINFQCLTRIMPQPIDINVNTRPWQLNSSIKSTLRGIVCINMIHIAPWECTLNLLEESGALLKRKGFLMLYGPFKKNGKHTSKSNFLFNQSLKEKNSSWGIRDLEEVIKNARSNRLEINNIIQMPANNHSLIFRAS